MGDTGSMALGGALAAFAIFTQDDLPAAPDRRNLRGRGALGDHPGVLVQVLRAAAVPDDPDSAPLRDEGLVRDEDHGPLLDRGRVLARRRSPCTTATSPVSAGSSCRSGCSCSGSPARGRRRPRRLLGAGWTWSCRPPWTGQAAAGRDDARERLELALLDGVELLVKSPGVPREAPLVAEAERRGIEIWSEVELGYRLLRPRLIGVTGTNGKTTTCELLGAMLPAGPVGRRQRRPRADRPRRRDRARRARGLRAVELPARGRARARLRDRGPAQPRARPPRPARIVRGLPRGEAADLRARRRRRSSRRARPRRVEFSAGDPLPAEPLSAARTTARTRPRRPPQHARPALEEQIAEALRTFPGVPHRLELVRELNGVSYVNDSKATNVAAALRALAAYQDEPVHLILGGYRKGEDFAPLAAALGPNVKSVHLIGETAAELAALDRRRRRRDGDLETRRRAPRSTPSRATSCCSRPAARATTSSATSKSAARNSGGWCRTCPRERTIRGQGSHAGHAGAGRVRPRDGLQRDLGLGRARERRPRVLPQAPGDLRAARPRPDGRGLAPRLPRPAQRSRRRSWSRASSCCSPCSCSARR